MGAGEKIKLNKIFVKGKVWRLWSVSNVVANNRGAGEDICIGGSVG